MPHTQSLVLGLVHNRSSNYIGLDFPGHPVVKNLPYQAGNVGSVPGRGSHMHGITKPEAQ